VLDAFAMYYWVDRANADAKERSESTDKDEPLVKKYLVDAYMAWAAYGFLGTHHYYLGNFWYGYHQPRYYCCDLKHSNQVTCCQTCMDK
jgi:hypothetical protein